MIKEYNGFNNAPKKITEPIIILTDNADRKHRNVWLRHPDGICSQINGAAGVHDLMFFFSGTRYKTYTADDDMSLTKVEFFAAVEEKCPEFFEWLLWNVDLF